MKQGLVGGALFCGLVALAAACGGSASIEGAPSPGAAGAGSGAAGAAPSSDDCSAPMVAGPCDALVPSFWHNPQTGLCEPFVYGGCAGNANRYATRDDCLKACPGGGSNWGACGKDTDCALPRASCCGACEPVTDGALLALNASHLADWQNATPCASVGACGPCLPVSVLVEEAKFFRPVCVAGQCSALDVRQSAYTECTGTSDCTLRAGVKCCQACMGEFVSVNARQDFCPDGPETCPKCAVIPPQELLAVCQDNRCVLQETLK